jgi:hypothetical protein
MSDEARNLEIFRELEAAFPDPGWQDHFRRTHAEDVVVNGPGARPPILGVEAHIADTAVFVDAFDDLRIHVPHRVLFADGDWTCSIAKMTGTMTGPMPTPDGGEVPATGKAFDLEIATIARWRDGLIVEENIQLDMLGFSVQVGLI